MDPGASPPLLCRVWLNLHSHSWNTDSWHPSEKKNPSAPECSFNKKALACRLGTFLVKNKSSFKLQSLSPLQGAERDKVNLFINTYMLL